MTFTLFFSESDSNISTGQLKSVLGPKHQDKTILDYLKQRDGVSYASALFLDNDFIPKPEFIESATKGYSASIINVNVTDGEEATKSVNR